MADPITREQVERAMDAAYDCNAQGVNAALGAEWYKDPRIPSDVLAGWRETGYTSLYRALTRWRDELVVARWDADRRMVAEGDPDGCDSSYDSDEMEEIRAAYAAALSAAEAERAAKPDHLAYADSPVWDDGPLPTPTPERPAPRFKVGDWVRVVTDPNSAGRINPIRVTCVTSAGYIMADGASWAAEHLTPALDPALRETARKTVAWLRGGARGTGPADFTTLPGWSDWNSGSRWDAAEHWAAQLERLLGDAP